MFSQKNSYLALWDQNKVPQSSGSPQGLSVDEKLLVMEALDHLHVTSQYQEMGSCVICRNISLKNCSGCKTYYCSNECQTIDWPEHRAICSRLLDNSSDCGSFASSRRMRCSASIKSLTGDPRGYMVSNRGSPFTYLANQLSKKSASVVNDNRCVTNFKIANKQYQNREPEPKENSVGMENGSVKEHKKQTANDRRKSFSPKKILNGKITNQSKKSPNGEKKSANDKKANKNNNRKSEANKLESSPESVEKTEVPSNEKTRLTTLGQIEVIGMYRESTDRYWVIPVDKLSKYEEIQEVLGRECKSYESAYPEVGLVCGCVFAGDWFRGKVLTLLPVPVVHFIDYGNVTNYNAKVFKKLPDYLQSLPGLVLQIEFEEGTPLMYKIEDLDSLKFKVEETSKTAEGIPRVKVIEGQYGTTEKMFQLAKPPEKKKIPQTNNQTKVRSVMDNISSNSNGTLFFFPGSGKIRFGSMVPDNNKEANDSIQKVLNIENSNSSPIRSQVGDYVLVTDEEGSDQRGKVLMKLDTTYYVLLVDCGNVISTKTVYPLPEDLKDLLELGVKITVEEIISEELMKDMETCFYEIKGEAESKKWPCTLIGPEQQPIARVSLEKPMEKLDWKPKFPYLKSGSTVEISSVSSPNSVYVRPVDGETEQKFLSMNMELIEFASKAKDFDFPPSPGELCCARFQEDGFFYRAVVNSVDGEKVSVMFVDFGNEQKTDLKDLKPLAETLKNMPLFAFRVELKNVSSKPWNNMIKEYIGKLSSENVELTLTYTESPASGVFLREKVSGDIVNDVMEKARDKSANNSKKSEIFLDDDLNGTKLTPGTKCTLAVLYVGEHEFITGQTFWATPADVDNFNYVNLELSSLIREHCQKVSTPYEPAFRELCLAEFEGSWYRAICVKQTGDAFKVFFVDFGNCCEVKQTSIRKMQKKFLTAPALALVCTVNGRDRLKGNADLTQEVFTCLNDKVNTFIEGVTVKGVQEDTFVLEIPEIEAKMARGFLLTPPPPSLEEARSKKTEN